MVTDNDRIVEAAELYTAPDRVVIVYRRSGKVAERKPFGVFAWCHTPELEEALESYNRAVHRWPAYLVYVITGTFEITEVRTLQTLLK